MKLIEQCEIDHSNISKYPEQFPLWILDEMQIDTTLSNIIDKKTSNTVFMKNISEQYINKNFSNYEHIYTDASKEDEKVGIGIYQVGPKKRPHFETLKSSFLLFDFIQILHGYYKRLK